MVSRLPIIMFVLMLLSGCGTIPDNQCIWVKPIYISKDDTLTEGTAKQILTHNEVWDFNTN